MASLAARLVRGYFDLWSSTYDLSPLQWVLYRPVHRAVLTAVERLGAAPDRMLDLGCGTARLTRDLMLRYPRGLAVGLDRSSGMLRASRRQPGAAAPALVQGDAYALPFATGSLSLVTCTIAYHWLLDPRAALAEIRRTLRPGGHLVLGTLVARLLPGRWFGMRLATVDRHREDLSAAGFVVESSQAVGLRVVVFTARAAVA